MGILKAGPRLGGSVSVFGRAGHPTAHTLPTELEELDRTVIVEYKLTQDLSP